MFFWICSTDTRFNGFRETYVFGAAFQSSALPLSTPDDLGHFTFRIVGENGLTLRRNFGGTDGMGDVWIKYLDFFTILSRIPSIFNFGLICRRTLLILSFKNIL